MNNQLLLIVEDNFYLHNIGLGLVVVPEVSQAALPMLKIGETILLSVMLKYPDGKIQQMKAQFQFSHFTPGGYKIICSFGDLKKEQVPIGTEILLQD